MADWGVIGVAVAQGGIVAFTWARERQAKREKKREEEYVAKYGLKSNPARCAEHAEAINGIKADISDEIKPDLKRIKDHLGIV